MSKSVILALGMLIMASGAAAAPPPAETAKPPKEKKVCKSQKITGSLTRVRRICMTQKEWDELAMSTRRDVDQIARDANRAQADLTRVAPAGGAGGGSMVGP